MLVDYQTLIPQKCARNAASPSRCRKFLDGVFAKAIANRSVEYMWHNISTAPFDRDLELAIIDDNGGVHTTIFPCRRILGGWVKAQTKRQVNLHPTHWREWGSGPNDTRVRV